MLSFEDNSDKNFKKACYLCSNKFSRNELFDFLKNGNIPEKQFAALEIDTVNNEQEANCLISNLTGCDGKIREAVAYKIKNIIKNTENLFIPYPEIFAQATIDINSNICRNIIETLKYISNNDFIKKYTDYLFLYMDEALEKLNSFNFRDKKYTINKQLFKIYWCLEGLNVYYEYLNEDILYKYLKKCVQIEEYTIREKVAFILKNNIKSKELIRLKSDLKNDNNYYVINI